MRDNILHFKSEPKWSCLILIYLDYNSTTPTDKKVVDAMLSIFTEHFGNPSSTHETGMHAADMMNDARNSVAALLGANTGDVVFTSGATEANNMAITGLVQDDMHILYGATEHKSVIEPCKMSSKTKNIRSIPVSPNGTIKIDELAQMLNDTSFVSIALANGETGVINPIKEISEMVHDADSILHCDITQAVGKIPVDVYDLRIDIATCSSHKLYGPKGVGALVASREIRKRITPLVYGGGQENDLRSGTQNVPGIVGFGVACGRAYKMMPQESDRQKTLRDYFETTIKSEVSDVVINGEAAQRLPNTSNIHIKGAMADAVLANTRDIEISSGSACSSNTIGPSHVLIAMGLDRTSADESVRISVGRQTALDDMRIAVEDLAQAAQYVREKEAAITESLK